MIEGQASLCPLPSAQLCNHSPHMQTASQLCHHSPTDVEGGDWPKGRIRDWPPLGREAG